MEVVASIFLEDLGSADFLQVSSQDAETHFADARLANAYSQQELRMLLQGIRSSETTVDDITEAWRHFKDLLESAQLPYVRKECDGCCDIKTSSDLLNVDCGHSYCNNCVTERVELATKDEALCPVKCCSEIPLVQVSKYLAPPLLGLYKEKIIEFQTLGRVYCSNPNCLHHILDENIDSANKVANCNHCRSTTCMLCKTALHQGQDCPVDTNNNLLLETAKQQGWMQCYSCGRVVELNTGCNHMECVDIRAVI